MDVRFSISIFLSLFILKFSEKELGLGHNLNQFEIQTLTKDEKITQISCGAFHSMYLREERGMKELYVFGDNS